MSLIRGVVAALLVGLYAIALVPNVLAHGLLLIRACAPKSTRT